MKIDFDVGDEVLTDNGERVKVISIDDSHVMVNHYNDGNFWLIREKILGVCE